MAVSLRTRWEQLGPGGFARWFLIKRIGKTTTRRIDQFIARRSLVGDPAIFDNANFPWVAELEANWRQIRRELDGVLEYRDQLPLIQDIQPDQNKIAPDDRWRTLVLYGYGFRSGRNCAACPETTRLIEQIPGMTSAWFSILAPGKHVPRHAGVTKGLIRCHLGLKVPAERERCRMQVADETFAWEEGHCVLFDDSRKHEVWNDTDEERVVLILDFERPMTWSARIAGRTLRRALELSPYVRDARRNQLAWEKRMDALATAVTANTADSAPH